MRVEGEGGRVRGGGDREGEADWEKLPLEWILDVFCMSFASVKKKKWKFVLRLLHIFTI